MHPDLLMFYRWTIRNPNEDDYRGNARMAVVDGPDDTLILYLESRILRGKGPVLHPHSIIRCTPPLCAADYANAKARCAYVKEEILKMF